MLLRTALTGLAAFCVMQSTAIGQSGAPTTGFAQVNQTSLRYQLAGTGPRTIVLLHELGMSLESWDDVVNELSHPHRVLRYDLRGFGLSEKLRGVVTIDDQVDDLRTLLDSLAITEPVTLVGGALGGAIALRFAAAQPQRVAAVMALSPAGDVAPAVRPAYLARAARLERLGVRADVDATKDDTYPPMLRSGHEDRFARFLALQICQRSGQYGGDTADDRDHRVGRHLAGDSVPRVVRCRVQLQGAAYRFGEGHGIIRSARPLRGFEHGSLRTSAGA